jgi:serine 3-dehydrogenase
MPTVLITGASSGIGAAIARALAPRHDLILVARRADRLTALATELGPRHITITADLADPAGLAAVVAGVAELDVLVNNAGVFALANGDAITADHLDGLWRINVNAPMLLTAALLPRLRAGGSVINVSSAVVENTFTSCGAYTASKCALEGWSRVLREELRPRRIRVGILAPGATATEVWPAAFAGAERSRMVQAADVAEAARLMVEAPPATSFDRIAVTPSSGAI